jgi:hypothetical protein
MNKDIDPEKQPNQRPQLSLNQITNLLWAIVALIETIQHFHFPS